MDDSKRPNPPPVAVVAVGSRQPTRVETPEGLVWRVQQEESWPPLRRNARMMSRGALLAAGAIHDALLRLQTLNLPPIEPLSIGLFLGVGASAGSMEDVIRLLRPALREGRWSGAAFARKGVGACNPTLAFQLMNNFTLAHAAILEGLGGPNGAIFSRGAGTTLALREAMWALHETDAPYAIAGGADSALHPVTASELRRQGVVRPLGEGAAVLILTREAREPLAWIQGADITEDPAPADAFEALAAGPALGWLSAIDEGATEALHRDTEGRQSRVRFSKTATGAR